ncbi:MAG: PAS domain S-box protein, partial [bacterium]|nr:PAS domain S-box protein [bacterium]
VVIAAALLFVFAKIMGFTRDIESLNGMAFIGDGGFLSYPLEALPYTLGILFLFLGFIWSAYEGHVARHESMVRNRELERESAERRRVEESLREAQERIELAMRGADLDFWYLMPRTGEVIIDGSGPESLGYERGEIPETLETWAERIHPDDRDRVRDGVRAHLEGRTESYEEDYRLRTRSGEYRWMLDRGRVTMRDEDGAPVRISGTHFDITSRKQAQEALAASEAKYRSFVENTPEPIARIDRDPKYVFVNRAFLELTGLREEDVIGKGLEVFRGFCHPDDVTAVMEDAEAVAQSGARRTSEIRVRAADGEWRWYAHLAYPWHHPDGSIGGVEAIGRDITEARRAAEMVRTSEETLRALFNATSDAAFLVDNDGFLLALNERFATYFEGSIDDLLGQNVYDLLPPELARHRRKYVDTAIRTGRPMRFEDCHGERWIDHSVYPVFEEGGAVTRLAVFARDVTARKHNEEERARLFAAIEQADESIIITDATGVIEYVNPAFERVMGYGRGETVGRTPRFLRSGHQDETFYEDMWAQIGRGEVWHGRFVNRRKDGASVEQESTITPIHNAFGEIINYVALQRDVTNEVDLERRLRQAQKMESIGTLAGGIAHDFNNILSLVLGHGVMALGNLPGSHPAHGNVQHIIKAGHRATELVKQILTFSRQVDQARMPLELHLVMSEALELLRASIPTTVEFRETIPADCGYVLADPTQMHQVVVNLCTNAYQAMGSAGGTLTVRLDVVGMTEDSVVDEGVPRDEQYVRLSVSDTGHGMDEATAQRVFDPFYTTKESGEGTGLGLSTVHGIVLSHDGLIRVESEMGIGTTFQVYLPRMGDAAAFEDGADESLTRGQGRVLFVDDDEEIVALNVQALVSLGYSVEGHTNALEALEAFRGAPEDYDLAITDQIMPQMTGMELAAELLTVRPDLPVVLVTGFSGGVSLEHAKSTGIRECLTKPVAVHTVSEVVKRMIEAERQLED